MSSKHIPDKDFSVIENGTLRDKTLSVNARFLYCILTTFKNWETGTCFPSRTVLAELLGVGQPTLTLAMTELKESGLLVVTSRFREDGSQASNLFTLKLRGTREKRQEETPPIETIPHPPIETIPLELDKEELDKDKELRSTERLASLAAAASSTPQPKKPRKRVLPPPRDELFKKGFPDTPDLPPALVAKPVDKWHCNDFLAYHQFLWRQAITAYPRPSDEPKHRVQFKTWITARGGEEVKTTLDYVFRHWDKIQLRYKALKSALPDVEVLFGWRTAFAKDAANPGAQFPGVQFNKKYDRPIGQEIEI